MVNQAAQNDERCQEWCELLETLRQNPGLLKNHEGLSSNDLEFSAAGAPISMLLAAARFGLNLQTAGGITMLLNILSDVVFRPEAPAKKGRPSGTKKWGQRELSNLGSRAAMLKDKNPLYSHNDIADELRKIFKEYQHTPREVLRQRMSDALQVYENKLATLRAAPGRL